MSSAIEITPELMAGFLDEAPEYLDMLDVGLMDFESKAGSGVLSLDTPEDQEQLTVMFRAAHSLKGLAAAFGFEKIKELTHRMETLFDQVRMRKKDLNADSFEVLFRVFDRLKALVQELSDDSAQLVEIEDILCALDQLLESTSEATGTNESENITTQNDTTTDQDLDQQIEAALKQVAMDTQSDETSSDSATSNTNEPPQAETPPSNSILQNELFDDPELTALFVETTIEAADELNQSLLGLEENPNNTELLNTVFRCAHNIKGASGAAGLAGMNRVTHEMETVFDHLRSGRITLSEPLMNAIFQTVDRLRLTIDNIRSGKPDDIADHEMNNQFQQWIDQGETSKNCSEGSRATLKEEQQNLPVSDSTGGSQNNNELSDSGEDDGKLMKITIKFTENFGEASIQAYLVHNKLGELGSIVSSNPDIEAVTGDTELQQIEFIIRTHVDPVEIKRVVSTYDVDCVVVSQYIQSSDSLISSSNAQDQRAQNTALAQAVHKPDVDVKSSAETINQEPVSKPAMSTESKSPFSSVKQSKLPTPPTPAPASAPSAKTTTQTTAQQKSPATNAEGKTAAPVNKPTETLRVDQERLDQLMNLGGELVINRARFIQIHGKFRQVFDGKNLGFLVEDISEHMSQLSEGIDLMETSSSNAREIEELRSHLLHMSQSFNAVRSMVNHVHELRTSMFDFDEALHGLSRVSDGIQKGIMSTRMVSIGPLFSRFRRVIRDISKANGKKVVLVLRGETTELDKRMIDELGDPLTHMVRNSVDHGLEMPDVREAAGKDPTGQVILAASHRGNSICIEVIDDGVGLNLERIKEKIIERELATPAQVESMTDKELYQYIFKPGFSTAEVVTELSGRGMGMDIVVSKIENLSGTVEVDSTPGQGAHVTIKLPLTLAILTSMVARIGKGIYALPLETVAEIITVHRDQIQWIQKRPVVRVRDRVIPIAFFEDIFKTDLDGIKTASRNEHELTLVIVGFESDKLGLVVDELLGQEDIVIKSIAENYENIRGFAGASIRGDGRVSLILDVCAMMEMAAESITQEPVASTTPTQTQISAVTQVSEKVPVAVEG